MTGTGGGRDDWPTPSAKDPTGKNGGKPVDPCMVTRTGAINSPKANVLGPLAVGSVLSVDVQTSGPAPILVVKDSNGAVGGSLTFVGFLELIDCIMKRGVKYTATITSINDGVYGVSVAPQ